MLISYDESSDAVYISLGLADRLVSRTEQLDAGTLVDLDAHGNLIGIEVIQPARHWPIDKVVEQFGLAPDAAEALQDFWRNDRPFPFAKSLSLVS